MLCRPYGTHLISHGLVIYLKYRPYGTQAVDKVIQHNGWA